MKARASALALLVIVAVMAGALAFRLQAIEAYLLASALCMHIRDGVAGSDAPVLFAVVGGSGALSVVLISAVAMIIRTRRVVRGLTRTERATSSRRVSDVARRADVFYAVDVVDSDEFIALCHGLIKPRILLSTSVIDALSDPELEAVMRHEMAHARRRDPLRALVVRSVVSALGIVPFASGVADAYLCSRELRADRTTVAAMGDGLPLASALRRSIGAVPAFENSALAVGALSATDLRIDQLLGARPRLADIIKPPGRLHAFLFASASAALICLLLASVHTASGVRLCVPC